MNGSYAVHRYSISASWNCSFPCGKIYLPREFSDYVLWNYHCMRISCRFVGGSTGGKKNRAESGNLHGLPACYDDSGDYWCKNLLCCIFMGFL